MEAIGFALSVFVLFFFGLIGLAVFGLYRLVTSKSRREERQRLEQQRQAAERASAQQAAERRRKQEEIEALQAAAETRRRQETVLSTEQSRLDDEALASRLRTAVSELIDLANVLTLGDDNSDIVRSMHGTINELAKRQREFKAHHFDDEMLQFDIALILKKLDQTGLKDDMIVERLKKAFQLSRQPAQIKQSNLLLSPPIDPSEPLTKAESVSPAPFAPVLEYFDSAKYPKSSDGWLMLMADAERLGWAASISITGVVRFVRKEDGKKLSARKIEEACQDLNELTNLSAAISPVEVPRFRG